MTAHTIHLGDCSSGCQKSFIDFLLVLEGDAIQRQSKQSRGAARDKTKHRVIGPRSLYQIKNALGSPHPSGIRDRMSGLYHLDALAAHRIAGTGYNDTTKFARPMIFNSARHSGGCLAGANDDKTLFGNGRQVGRNAHAGLCGSDRCIKHASQQGTSVRHSTTSLKVRDDLSSLLHTTYRSARAKPGAKCEEALKTRIDVQQRNVVRTRMPRVGRPVAGFCSPTNSPLDFALLDKHHAFDFTDNHQIAHRRNQGIRGYKYECSVKRTGDLDYVSYDDRCGDR